ncbi:hypothetical protein [Spongiimicrobium salis]|uniref:hypothetical protein n=1 Tax=Spongiimicrobium salis TaxID=1667022 RepID=UPI00374DB76D
MKRNQNLKKIVCALTLMSLALVFTNCSKEDAAEFEGEAHAFSACIDDGTGSCDEDIILFDPTDPTDPGSGGTSTPPSLSSRFRYYHRGNSGDNIFTSSSSSGRGNWSGSVNTNGNNRLDDQSISATQFGNRVAVVHQGRTSNTIFYSFSRDGRNFTRDRSIPTGARTSGTIKTVEFNGRLFVYHHNGSSNRIYYNSTSNGTNWVGNRPISDANSYLAFDVVVLGNRLFLVSLTNSSISVSSSTDGINFSRVTRDGLGLNVAPRNIDVVAVDDIIYILFEDRRISSRTRNLSIGKWINGSNPIGFVSFVSIGTTTDQPATIASDGTTLVVAYENDNGNGITVSYNTAFRNIPRNQTIPPSSWRRVAGSGRTSLSGVSLIYTE